jgi:hypothetical protein
MATTALTAVAVASLIRSIQEISSELKKVTDRLDRLERAIDKNTDAVKRSGR